MGTVTTLPTGRPLTRDDLERVPDDGRRYELIDGSLIVTPAPSRRHQLAAARLHALLWSHCPAHLTVLFAPVDVAVSNDTSLQPDLLVVERTAIADETHPIRPLLAVEILSPSTRHIDLSLKRDRFEEAGCPSYWVIDPDEPAITVWELRDSRYVRRADVSGDDACEATEPYRVTLTPSRLLD